NTRRSTFTQLLRNWTSQKKTSHLQNTHQSPTINLFNKYLGLIQGNCINIFQAFASGFCGGITTKQTPTNPHLHMFTNPPKKKRRGRGKHPPGTNPHPHTKKPWQHPTLPPHHRAVPSA